MKGRVKFSVKNKHIKFQFTLERNVTIITGDSGTGKTKLINMVRQYDELGKSSGVSLSCKNTCIVLEGKNWEQNLENVNNSIVFIEESSSFLRSKDFAKAIQKSDNYYVIVTREPLVQISYSVDSIMQIIKKGSNPKLDRMYKKIGVKKISHFPYDIVIVEDSNSGFQFFECATKDKSVKCVSAKGKSNILTSIKKCKEKKILVIADAAALGSEISEIEQYRNITNKKIDLYLPESFEWLLLKSEIFSKNSNIQEILADPIEHIESSQYFSWEKFFEYLLVEETKNSKSLKYDKKKLVEGYMTDNSVDLILKAME